MNQSPNLYSNGKNTLWSTYDQGGIGCRYRIEDKLDKEGKPVELAVSVELTLEGKMIVLHPWKVNHDSRGYVEKKMRENGLGRYSAAIPNIAKFVDRSPNLR